jgi:hypothetical protein
MSDPQGNPWPQPRRVIAEDNKVRVVWRQSLNEDQIGAVENAIWKHALVVGFEWIQDNKALLVETTRGGGPGLRKRIIEVVGEPTTR